MLRTHLRRFCTPAIVLLSCLSAAGQSSLKPKYTNSTIYTGIEVGSKGVKLSVIEIGKNAQSSGSFNILKDTSINTDFISFTPATLDATLNGLYDLYAKATKEYKIPSKRVFTVISSGVKMQAEKDDKYAMIYSLIDQFRKKIDEPDRKVEVVDAMLEGSLSHLGIVPESRRYTTFLIDIGSGNTKGGFFPHGNTKDFKLFQVNWGTKSTANAAEKRLEGGDNTLPNYNKQLFRVLAGAENTDIIYAVNSSGAYPLSDNVAVSGGIAWAIATLLRPDLFDNSVVPITYDELVKFNDQIFNYFNALTPEMVTRNIDNAQLKEQVMKEVKRVHSVFDQKSLMAGTGLLLKIMRQFESAFESKQYFLVKNGQVGWVSAYVDQSLSNK
jgi:hypothetical protein